MNYQAELNKVLSILKNNGVEPFYEESCNTIFIYEKIGNDVSRQLEASPIVNDVCNEYEYTYDEMDFDYNCFSHVSVYLFADDSED